MDNQSQLQQFASAITGAATEEAPGASPMGETQEIQNIQQMHTPRFQAQATGQAADALGQQAAVEGQHAQEDAEIARAQETAELEDKIDALTNPDRWEAIPIQGGGYDFRDGTGEPVTPVEYARATNQRVTDIIGDSQDPLDQEFLRDYEFVKDLGDVFARGNREDYEQMKEKYPEMWERSQTPEDYDTYDDLLYDFKREYPEYFGSDIDAGIGTGSPVGPEDVQGSGGLGNFLSGLMS